MNPNAEANKAGGIGSGLIIANLAVWAGDVVLAYLGAPLVDHGIGYWLGFVLGQTILPLALAALFAIGKRLRNIGAGAKVFLVGMVLQLVINLTGLVLPN